MGPCHVFYCTLASHAGIGQADVPQEVVALLGRVFWHGRSSINAFAEAFRNIKSLMIPQLMIGMPEGMMGLTERSMEDTRKWQASEAFHLRRELILELLLPSVGLSSQVSL